MRFCLVFFQREPELIDFLGFLLITEQFDITLGAIGNAGDGDGQVFAGCERLASCRRVR